MPLALQPYLADLLRRSLFPIPGIVVKIAAIEHRSQFKIKSPNDYIGIELGADASADINLDDFMVFDNDEERAKHFFEALVGRHVLAILEETNSSAPHLNSSESIVKEAFTEKRAIEEFVRASEGVPRDAINILSLAAQKAHDSAISVADVRSAARTWYQRDKERAVSADSRAHALLHHLVHEVIGKRKARAFLLTANSRSEVIESLYDARVLHILKRGVSSHAAPGVRYDAYKLDYGCYVDLLATHRSPQGLFQLDDEEQYLEVPPDDYRSIRRAILEIDTWENNTPF